MKRLSNKRRALAYIRQKNDLRKGAVARNYVKISKEMIDDESFIFKHLQPIIKETIKTLKTKFKLNFECVNVSSGLHEDDFVKDIVTVMFTFKVIRS